MKPFRHRAGSQEGSTLLVVIIVLALLTIIGVSITSMSTTELQIATNDANYKKAFFHSESGIYTVAKWIHTVNETGAVPAAGVGNRFTYLDKDASGDDDLAQVLSEVMGYASAYDGAADIEFTMATPHYENTVSVDFDRRRAIPLEGGSAASLGEGASSVGTGPIFGLPYWIESTASRSNGETATVSARYLKITGVVGGM